MEFLLSKRLEHLDGFTKLIPKLCKPLEETVIAIVGLERGIKIRELTAIEIRNRAKIDKYIKEEKK